MYIYVDVWNYFNEFSTLLITVQRMFVFMHASFASFFFGIAVVKVRRNRIIVVPMDFTNQLSFSC